MPDRVDTECARIDSDIPDTPQGGKERIGNLDSDGNRSDKNSEKRT